MIGLDANPVICRRHDLTMPALVFGGLLVAATALCAVDSAPSAFASVDMEEVKVAVDQPTGTAPEIQEPVAMSCNSELSRPMGLSNQTPCKPGQPDEIH